MAILTPVIEGMCAACAGRVLYMSETCIQHTLIKSDDCAFPQRGVVRHHDIAFPAHDKPLHKLKYLLSRDPVKVASRLVRNDNGWVGDNGAGYGNALLLPPDSSRGNAPGVGEVDDSEAVSTCAFFSFSKPDNSRGSSTFS